jgi:hypothetical protein
MILRIFKKHKISREHQYNMKKRQVQTAVSEVRAVKIKE